MIEQNKIKAEVLSDRDKEKWRIGYDKLPRKGAYHSPEYIWQISSYYSGTPELFWAESKENCVYYPYIKRNLKDYINALDMNLTGNYWDIISSWYYGGPVFFSKTQGSEVPRAFVIEFLSEFANYCKRENIISEFVRFDPNLKNYLPLEPVLSLISNRNTVIVDLRKSKEDLWNGLESRNRNRLRNAEEYGFQSEFTTNLDAVEIFHEIYIKEMNRKNADAFHCFPKKFFFDLFKACPETFYLMLTKKDSKYMGGIICAKSGGVIHDFLRASLKTAWTMNINNWMIFRSILYAKNTMNASWYDLQGGRDGVYHFKSGFSKDRRQFKTFAKIHNREMYKILSDKYSGKYKQQDENYFPAYRIDELKNSGTK